MPSPAFSFTLDHAQWRVRQDRLATLISGGFEPDLEQKKNIRGWDVYGTRSGNDLLTYVEPVNGVLMLTPAPLLQAWGSTFTGIYARLAKADFTLANASKWVNHNTQGNASDYWLHGVGLSNEGGVTTASWAKNRGFFLAGLAYSTGRERSTVWCGWNSSVSGASGVSVKLYSDGEAEVWKDGEFIGSGSVMPTESQKGQFDNVWLGILLIPYRKRELLVLSTLGGGFATVFEDIDESDPDPTITGATNFWFYVEGSNRTATLQIAPIRYPSSAYRAGIVTVFPEAPAAGEVAQVEVYYDAPGYGAVSVSGGIYEADDPTTVFTPDGTTTRARARVDLTGDGESTPFVYGLQAEYPVQREQTDDSEETVLDESVIAADIGSGEDPGSFSCEITLKGPDALNVQILEQVNRPLKVTLGESFLFDLFTDPVRLREAHGDENRRVLLRARNRWKSLESYRFVDPTPLDGLTLREAFLKVCRAAGIQESETDVEDDAFTLPTVGKGGAGDWNVLIEPGDTAADWLNRLKESYAGTWFLDFVPAEDGPVLRFKSPEELGEESVLTIYTTDEDAEDEGVTADERRHVVCWSFEESSLENEANDIRVLGMEPRTRRPIAVHYPDRDSQDPTTAPSGRPDNWLGEVRRYGYIEPYLSSLEACERAATLLFHRLTQRRYMAEWDSELLLNPDSGLPIWRGDVVTVFGRGDYRIVAVSFTVEREPTTEIDFVHRRAHYVAEKLTDDGLGARGCGQRTVGTTIQEMRAFTGLSLVSRTVVQRGGEGLERRPVVLGSILP